MHVFGRLLGIYANNRSRVLLHNLAHETAVLQQLLLYHRVLVLDLVLKAGQDCLILDVLAQDIVIAVGQRVETALLELFVYQVVTHVEGDHEARLHVQLLEHAYLVHGCWRALQDPAVGLAIGHLEALPQAPNCMVIRDHIATLQDLPKVLRALTLPSYRVFHQLIAIDVDELVLLRERNGMLAKIHARWAHHDDLWRLARGVAVLEKKEASHLFNDLLLALVAIDLDDVAHELLLDSLDVNVVLCDGVLRDLVQLLRGVVLDTGTLLHQLDFEVLDRHVVGVVQHEKLVRMDLLFLQRKCLQSRSREAFQNPTGVALT